MAGTGRKINKIEIEQTQTLVKYYMELFKRYGYSENALGWTKNKQYIRFETLFRFLDLQDAAVLDVGCGFGDMLIYIKNNLNNCNIQYQGVDIMEEFIEHAKTICDGIYAEKFYCGNFMTMECTQWERIVDYIVASGIFGFKIFNTDEEQYKYIDQFINKSLKCSRKAVVMDFLSDKVDYHSGKTDFHADPAKILDIAYQYSRNVILDNSVMPFEFCLTIYKEDDFNKKTTIFNTYLKRSQMVCLKR